MSLIAAGIEIGVGVLNHFLHKKGKDHKDHHKACDHTAANDRNYLTQAAGAPASSDDWLAKLLQSIQDPQGTASTASGAQPKGGLSGLLSGLMQRLKGLELTINLPGSTTR